MQHFFVDKDQIDDGHIYIKGEDLNHLKNVLRMKPGDEVCVNDGEGNAFFCQISYFTREEVILDIIREEKTKAELASKVYLFQGIPKGDKMDMIIQKAVELGVYQVIPVAMSRCVVKLDSRKKEKRRGRWKEIAKAAAKQSGRGIIPQISEVLSFEEAVNFAKNMDLFLLPYEEAKGMAYTRSSIEAIRKGESVGIFIGPEGGFDKKEVDLAAEAGARIITLGRRILRTETAGLAVLAILMYHLEEA